MSFIDNLKQLKNEKKMTTSALSQASGVPLGTLSKLLSGAIEEPKISVAFALASAMSVPLDVLCGAPAGTDCLSREEEELVDCYRIADAHARESVLWLARHEAKRAAAVEGKHAEAEVRESQKFADKGHIILPLYLLPVSAGMGSILETEDCETVEVRNTRISSRADFALRVRGNSMEPNFHDSDLLLVQKTSEVEHGELAIFIGDGEGFFKCYLGDRLHSLNPKYADIPIASFESFTCCGRVIGRVPAKI